MPAILHFLQQSDIVTEKETVMSSALGMKDFDKMDRPRLQTVPGIYGEEIIRDVVIRDLTLFSDERGFLFEVMRMNDKEMNAPDIKQIIASYSYPGMIIRMASSFEAGRSSGVRYRHGQGGFV